MFGDSAQHFLQTFEALSRLTRLPIIRLGLLVFWTDVSRHDDLAERFWMTNAESVASQRFFNTLQAVLTEKHLISNKKRRRSKGAALDRFGGIVL